MKNRSVLKGKINLKANDKVSLIVNLASSNNSSTTKLIVFLSTDAILSNLFVMKGLCKTSRATVQLRKCIPNLLFKAFSYFFKLLFKLFCLFEFNEPNVSLASN